MKTIISIALVTLVSLNLCAQEIEPARQQPKFSFGFAPLSLLFNKTRFELETGVGKKSPVMISVSPIFYSGTTQMYSNTRHIKPDNSEADYSSDLVSGMGGEMGIKFMKVLDPFHLSMIYYGFGVGYHKINLSYQDYDFQPYQEDGLTYYNYQLGDVREDIQRTNVFGLLGGRTYAGNRIYFDLSIGLGYQKSNIKSSAFQPRDHESSIFGFGYTGFCYKAVLSVGFSLF